MRELRPQTVDDLFCTHLAFIQRLQGDKGEAAVGRTLTSRESHYVLDRSVRLDNAYGLLYCIPHRVERSILRPLHSPAHRPSVLLREESFRDLSDQKDIQPKRAQKDNEQQCRMVEHPAETLFVSVKDPFEAPLTPCV